MMATTTRARALTASLLLLVLFVGAPVYGRSIPAGRKLKDATAEAGSLAEAYGQPSLFDRFPSSFAGARGNAFAQGGSEAAAATQSEASTTPYTPDWYCNLICDSPGSSATAESLSEAYASGPGSAKASALSEAIAQAGSKCCNALTQALASAKSYAESIGSGQGFAEASSEAYASAGNSYPWCAKQALARASSYSESYASNGSSSAGGAASANAQGNEAYTTTQTQSSVGNGHASSSSSSKAVARGM